MALLRWETDKRYYAATMYQDLLGDTILARCWGGQLNNLGRMVTTPVQSTAAGKSALHAIAKERQRRRYRLVNTSKQFSMISKYHAMLR
jgi:hypothetical protein